jgi:receptor protein-tyrosine kinase
MVADDNMNFSMEGNNPLDQALVVLKRRWPLIVACAIIAGLAAVGFSLLQRAEYTSSATLLFDDQQPDQQLFSTASTTSSPVDPTQQAATDLSLVSLPIIASRTAAALHASTHAIGAAVTVSAVGQSSLAKVSVTDSSPVRAAQIANTYAQQYILFRQQSERAQLAAAQTLVKHELTALARAKRFGSIGQTLQNQSNELHVMAALQTGQAELVQPATVPSSPSSPDKKRNALLGIGLGLLLGIGLAFAIEHLDRSIRGASDLEEAYGVPILGAIPQSPMYAAVGKAPLPPGEAEAFALLRARLRYFNVDREIRSLLVTSAMPGEGKTTVAINLATAEAVAGNSKVVIVEADLRRPTIAARLGIESAPGLAEILSRNASLEEAMREVAVDTVANGLPSHATFTVIPSGALPPNPAELLESRAMLELLATLSEQFELVLIDSPPTSVVSDAIPLLRLVSGTIIVGRMKTTTRDAARHLREQLTKLNSPTLGVVANAITAQSGGYYGYAQYSSTYAAPNGTSPKELDMAEASAQD